MKGDLTNLVILKIPDCWSQNWFEHIDTNIKVSLPSSMQYIPDGIFRIFSFFSKVTASNNIKELIADNYFILGGICKALTNNLQSNLKELPKDMLS